MHLNPAKYVIHVLGGVTATAKAIGRAPASVSKWTASKKNRGSAGRIPGRSQMLILEYAGRYGKDITPSDLMFGRKVFLPIKKTRG